MRQLVIAALLGTVLVACGGGGGGVTAPPCEGACVVAIAAANSEGTTCALLAGGGVKCWGDNDLGQLGTDAVPVASTAAYSARPVSASISGATALAASFLNGCAVLGGGAVRCWGYNFFGQLGVATPQFQPQPRQLQNISGAQAVTIGNGFACALLGPSAVKCWGWNDSGQLGNGTRTNSLDPVNVGTLEGVTAVSSGGAHVCALVSGGAVKCWGYNYNGELGNPGVPTRNAEFVSADPVPAATTITGAVALAAGGNFTCALVGGAVKCWGKNDGGELGAAAPALSVEPVTVASVSGATSIAAGYDHACAIVAGGNVKCWGANDKGKLGNGSTSGTRANGYGWFAEEVVGLTGATAITAAGYHTCALIAGTGVKCWGANDRGQLGDGTLTERHTPVDVLF